MKQEERLLYALNDIDDGLIAEAGEKPKGFSWRPLAALAACAALVAGLIGGSFGGGMSDGGAEGLNYDVYAGPVMPLSLMEPVEGLTAERDVTYDFSYYSETSHDIIRIHTDVTDAYTIHNTTDRDMTVEAVYPFKAKLQDKEWLIPRIAVDGAQVGTVLTAGADLRGDSHMDSGEKLIAMLSDGGYFAEAFGGLPDMNIPCTVYHVQIKDYDGEVGELITLKFGFQADLERTKVLLYSMSSLKYEEKDSRFSTHLDLVDREGYVIFVGQDIADYTLQGYLTAECKQGDEVDGFDVDVSRTETTLGAWMAADIDWPSWWKFYNDGRDLVIANCLTNADVMHHACDQLLGDSHINPMEDGQIVFLDDVISAAVYADRMMYLTFPVTVPAGGTVTVTAQQVKPSSTSHMNQSEDDHDGYDLMTTLGTVLPITEQTVRAVNIEGAELVDNSFGFDWAKGITEAELDPNVQHYWMKVKAYEPHG